MSESQSRGERGRLRGMHILVAEDIGLEADLIAVKLEEQGAIVVGPFASVTNAIRSLETSRIDIALVDMVLSDQPADRLLEALANRGTPHIVITGYGPLPTNASETALARVSKPIDWDYLWTQITQFHLR